MARTPAQSTRPWGAQGLVVPTWGPFFLAEKRFTKKQVLYSSNHSEKYCLYKHWFQIIKAATSVQTAPVEQGLEVVTAQVQVGLKEPGLPVRGGRPFSPTGTEPAVAAAVPVPLVSSNPLFIFSPEEQTPKESNHYFFPSSTRCPLI